MQQVSPQAYRGKRVRLSADIETAGVEGAGLWMRLDGKTVDDRQEQLVLDNMNDRRITGTTARRNYQVVLDVPEVTKNIAFGVMLRDGGSLEVGSFALETVGAEVPVTGEWGGARPAPRNLEPPAAYFLRAVTIQARESNRTP